jgi:hypothetical protein
MIYSPMPAGLLTSGSQNGSQLGRVMRQRAASASGLGGRSVHRRDGMLLIISLLVIFSGLIQLALMILRVGLMAIRPGRCRWPPPYR